MRRSSGRCSGPARSPRWGSESRPRSRAASRARARELVRPQPASSMAGRGRVRVLARPRSRRGLRGAAARAPLVAPRGRGEVDRNQGGRPDRGRRPDPGAPPHDGARARSGRRRRASLPRSTSRRPPLPAARRQACARPRSRGRYAAARTGPGPGASRDIPTDPAVLGPYGDGLDHDGRYRDAVAAYEEAIDLFRASGQIRAAAAVISKLAGTYGYAGDPRYPTLTREAVTLLEPLGPTPELATALRRLATYDVVSSRFEEALVGLDRALVVGESCQFPSEREALLFVPRSPAGAASCAHRWVISQAPTKSSRRSRR